MQCDDDYHVAMATVPIDTWYTGTLPRRQSSEIIKKRLSLLMHGVNHTYAELQRRMPRGALESVTSEGD